VLFKDKVAIVTGARSTIVSIASPPNCSTNPLSRVKDPLRDCPSAPPTPSAVRTPVVHAMGFPELRRVANGRLGPQAKALEDMESQKKWSEAQARSLAISPPGIHPTARTQPVLLWGRFCR
jgi:hypothetical protein